MPATTSYSPTGNPYINGVLGDLKWAVNSFTFSFPALASDYGSNYGMGETGYNFGALNAGQQWAARSALAQFSAVANVTFQEIGGPWTAGADIRFALSDRQGTAWAYFPTANAAGGDVWFNNSKGYYVSPVKGNYAYTTFLHEIGHSMGLEHAHEHFVMPADRDSMEYTVMSYRSHVGSALTGYTNETWGFAQSLMMYDIAALQHMYGANYSTQAGDTRYMWDPFTGEAFINGAGQGRPGGNQVFQTIWDGGGWDTYDLSNYGGGVSLDLRPGHWTRTSNEQVAYLGNGHHAAGNVANALLHNNNPASLIENAVGGAGHDWIAGNHVSNDLVGNGGNDELYGLEANDRLFGGTGNDKLDFGAGADIGWGGEGDDLFVFTPGSGLDVLRDFVAATQDLLQFVGFSSTHLTLTGTAMAGLLPGTQVSLGDTPVAFLEGVAATTLSLADFSFLGTSVSTSAPALNILSGRALSFDFNGDGHDDLLWRHDGGAITTWHMKGASAVQNAYVNTTVDNSWRIEGAADFNGDGRDDILWRNDAGVFTTWQMNGSTAAPNTYVNATVDKSWHLAGTGDFNGDGRDDLLWRHEGGGLTTWQMNGNTAAPNAFASHATPDWRIAGTGDFNGDGRDDILWRHDSGWVTTWQMHGSQADANVLAAHVGMDWKVAGIGDFNGDGRDDLLWRNDNGTIATWEMNGSQPAMNVLTAHVGNEWQVENTGDFNGDGRDDIAWRHDGGLVTTWQMNGPTAEMNVFGTHVATDWQLSP